MALKLNLPINKVKDSSLSIDIKTLNFVLCANDKVLYYQGLSKSDAVSSNYASTGIRQIINGKRKELFQKFKRADDMVVLIKPPANPPIKTS